VNRVLRFLRSYHFATLAAWVILAVGLFSSLFWQPAPNRVVVPVVENSEQTVLQVYYRYGFPGPGSFFEYYSDKELLHRSGQTLEARFELPGWQRLRAVRLDLGNETRSFALGPVEFGYEWAYRFYPLFHLSAEQLIERAELNDQIASARAAGESLEIEVEGVDPYLILPVSREDWLNALPTGTLWWLRLVRVLTFLAVAGLVYLAGRLLRSGWLARAGTGHSPTWNRLWWVGSLAGILGIGFLVYEPYLTFQKLFLFKDVATDSVDVFWPIFLHISEYFRSEGYPLWTFSIGVGQGLFGWIGDPFLFLIYLLPPLSVGFALGWLQLLKTVVAGIFFLNWLRLLGVGRFAATVGTVGLVFSAHMVIRGNWTHYATEVVMVAFALFAFECFLRKRFWQLLPLAILFLVIRSVFHTYVWSILFLSYAVLRMWLEAGWQPRWMGRKILELAGCYLLGLGLSAVFLFPNLAELLNSPRVTGGESTIASFAQSSLWGLNQPEEWLSSLYGLFAPDLLGRGSFYSGWANYLEGPHLYVGTLAVLLLPQAFFGRSRRLQGVLLIAVAAVLLYLFVPYARYALNGFSGVYYKTSSFWVSLVVAGMGVLALDNLVRRRVLNIWVLGGTLVLLLIAMRLLLHSEFVLEWLRVKESYRVYRQVVFLLFAYSVVLVFLRLPKLRSFGLLLLPVLVAWEVVQFAGESVQDRLALRGDTMETGGYYFDDSYSAVRMIERADSGFYRIEKGNVSVHLNDSLGQSYRGLSSYYSFNAGGYLSFLGPDGFEVDYLVPGHGSAYVMGTGERTVLASLLSTKYFITREWGNQTPPFGYRPWGRAGDARIYRNDCFIPLGSVYSHGISEDAVRRYPPEVRDLIALAAAVVPSDGTGVESGTLTDLPEEELQKIETAAEARGSREWESFYYRLASDLAKTAVDWSVIEENRLIGSVYLEEPGLVYLSIPENDGWTATVNDQPVSFVPVHFGFRGIPLEAGLHRIELHYFPPFMKLGMGVSGTALLGWIILSMRRR